MLQEEWRKIMPEAYINLGKSMPNRIEACVKSQGMAYWILKISITNKT